MKIKLFANLAEEAGTRQVELEPPADATVGVVLEQVFDRHPPLRELILDADGELVGHINVLVNGSNIEHSDAGLSMAVSDDDEIAIFPPVSGGMASHRA